MGTLTQKSGRWAAAAAGMAGRHGCAANGGRLPAVVWLRFGGAGRQGARGGGAGCRQRCVGGAPTPLLRPPVPPHPPTSGLLEVHPGRRLAAEGRQQVGGARACLRVRVKPRRHAASCAMPGTPAANALPSVLPPLTQLLHLHGCDAGPCGRGCCPAMCLQQCAGAAGWLVAWHAGRKAAVAAAGAGPTPLRTAVLRHLQATNVTEAKDPFYFWRAAGGWAGPRPGAPAPPCARSARARCRHGWGGSSPAEHARATTAPASHAGLQASCTSATPSGRWRTRCCTSCPAWGSRRSRWEAGGCSPAAGHQPWAQGAAEPGRSRPPSAVASASANAAALPSCRPLLPRRASARRT